MDIRNNKRRDVLTHARVNFGQSETSSLLRGGGWGVKFWGSTVGGLTEKIPRFFENYHFMRIVMWRYYWKRRRVRFFPDLRLWIRCQLCVAALNSGLPVRYTVSLSSLLHWWLFDLHVWWKLLSSSHLSSSITTSHKKHTQYETNYLWSSSQ